MMKMKWNIAAVALLLSACSSQPSVSYYQLPPMTVQSNSHSGKVTLSTARQLWVESVNIADFLSGSGIAYQTSDVKYTKANNNLWGSNLEQQLKQSLTNNLSGLLNGWIVSGQPVSGGREVDVLRVTVNGFHGRYDGYGVVSGYWILQRGEQVVRRQFDIEMPLQKDGYDELVNVLARAWQQESVEIANALRN